MAEITRETINTQGNTGSVVAQVPATTVATNSQTLAYLIYFSFGALEILLVFRLILKIMGASTSSVFVNGIYGISGFFTWPFEGIFRSFFNAGVETTSVLEPSTLVAIAVYGVIAWGVVKLVQISSREQQQMG